MTPARVTAPPSEAELIELESALAWCLSPDDETDDHGWRVAATLRSLIAMARAGGGV